MIVGILQMKGCQHSDNFNGQHFRKLLSSESRENTIAIVWGKPAFPKMKLPLFRETVFDSIPENL